MNSQHGIAAARGEQPADLVIKGVRLVNVFSGEIYPTDIAIQSGQIIGHGPYQAHEVFNASGLYAVPGFIDAHIHLESTCLTVPEFAKAVVPLGTTTVITDPHEIANVLGLDGIRYMFNASQHLPLNVFFMLPSCVPATKLETSGASLEAADLAAFLDDPRVLGLAELMNYSGVLARDPHVLSKISLAQGKLIDGHAPGLKGRDLCAYIGAGIRTDHECTTVAEVLEKLRLGMHILIREGSVAKNLETLLPAVTPTNASRFGLVSDDRYPTDLLTEGHMNGILRKAVRLGLPEITAIQMATLNPAAFYSLHGLGQLAPGFKADLVLLEDLRNFMPAAVFKEGKLVAQNGRLTIDLPQPPHAPKSTINIGWDRFRGFEIPAPAQPRTLGRVIELIPDQILTRELILPLLIRDGMAVADPERDLAKLAVVERHKATGNVGLGFVQGLGLREGAFASSVAHDSHNIIVAGMNDEDMLLATKTIEQLQGGFVAVNKGKVVESSPLPIAGLLSDRPLNELAEQIILTLQAARSLGCSLTNPFMTLSFLALPVIPALKLTDRGLVDIDRSAFVPLLVPNA
jgi:adenine deaminase